MQLYIFLQLWKYAYYETIAKINIWQKTNRLRNSLHSQVGDMYNDYLFESKIITLVNLKYYYWFEKNRTSE